MESQLSPQAIHLKFPRKIWSEGQIKKAWNWYKMGKFPSGAMIYYVISVRYDTGDYMVG